MALSDYRLCDVCGNKAFYDANLNYLNGPTGGYHDFGPYRIAGQPQMQDADMNQKHGMRLDYVGDWSVICEACAKKYKTIIVPINFAEPDTLHSTSAQDEGNEP